MLYTIKSKYVDEGKKGKWLKRISLVILVLILMAASFGSGLYISQKSEIIKKLAETEAVYLGSLIGKYGQGRDDILNQDVNFNLFWEVWDTLEKEYVDKGKLNDKAMFYGALNGLVASVGDPYTVFMDPKFSREFEDDLAGTFEGIGAEIGIRKEALTIIAPLDGTPAQKAGLQPGDKIYSINGEITANMTVDEAVAKIRGPKGTNVTLTIVREGNDAPRDIVITRSVITVKSVKTETLSSAGAQGDQEEKKDNDIFVLEISNFNNDTLDLFNKAVQEILSKNPKGIILDLRNNPGGYLDTAIELASEWVESGAIVTEKSSEENKNEYLSRGRARLKDYPTVVLVNRGSASASEILAGALRDYKKATIVGEQTFGKGSVQTLREFGDGSSIKITVAKWFTPNGDSIDDVGIKPDIEVEMTDKDYEEDKDPQMDKAIEILKGK
ncbi:MAG: S41 family peptidase [Patescibacteria group bacterium]|nr:S41 family peptidase [Patescibacteria group bacterium]MDD5295172.1 S41 family peptidase [Patescibacteria group bacterium]MDD5554813.1 S41 family peptidase [Patescibacteria group bacterium]